MEDESRRVLQLSGNPSHTQYYTALILSHLCAANVPLLLITGILRGY